ncbi:MAG: hypothetical protein ABI208_07415 [Ginsengibacter sp.]
MKFTSTKSLIFIILVLFLTNVLLLFFFVSKRDAGNKNHASNGLYTVLKDSVGFSENQLAQYQDLRTHQFEQVKPLFDQIRKSKENFYQLIYEENLIDSIKMEKADSIGQSQKMLDLQMFNYFKEVRNICTPEQLPQFDKALQNVVKNMTGRRKKAMKH